MKLHFSYSSEEGSDVIGIISPEGIMSFRSGQNLLDNKDPRVKPGRCSRSGYSGHGWLEDNKNFIFKPGHFSLDHQDDPTWRDMPDRPGVEIAVGVYNENGTRRCRRGVLRVVDPEITFFDDDDEAWLVTHQLLSFGADADEGYSLADCQQSNGLPDIHAHKTEVFLGFPAGIKSQEKFKLYFTQNRFGLDARRFAQPRRENLLWPYGSEINHNPNNRPMEDLMERFGLVPVVLQKTRNEREVGFAVVKWGRITAFYPGDRLNKDIPIPGWNWDEAKHVWWRPEDGLGFRVLAWDPETETEYEATGFSPIHILANEANEGIARKIAADAARATEEEERGAEFEAAITVLIEKKVMLTIADSVAVGNCPDGTRDFLRRFDLPQKIEMAHLVKHPRYDEMKKDRQFQRVILARSSVSVCE